MPSDDEGILHSPIQHYGFSSPINDTKKRTAIEDMDDGRSENQLQAIHLPLKKQYMQDHHMSSSPSHHQTSQQSSPTSLQHSQEFKSASPILLHPIDIDDSLNSTLEIDISAKQIIGKTVQSPPSRSTVSKNNKTVAEKMTKRLEEDLAVFPYQNELESYRKRAIWLQYIEYRRKYTDLLNLSNDLKNKAALLSSFLREFLKCSEPNIPQEMKSKIESILTVDIDIPTGLKSNSFLLEKINLLSSELVDKESKLSSLSKKYERHLLLSKDRITDNEKPVDTFNIDNDLNLKHLVPDSLKTTASTCIEHVNVIENQETKISSLESEIKDLQNSIMLRDNELQSLTVELVRSKEDFNNYKLKYMALPSDINTLLDYNHQVELIQQEKDVLKTQVDRLVYECDTLYTRIKEELVLKSDSIINLEKSFEDAKEILTKQLKDAVSQRDIALSTQEEVQRKANSIFGLNQELQHLIDILNKRISVDSSKLSYVEFKPDEAFLAQELETTAEAFDLAVKNTENLLNQLSTKEELVVKLHGEKVKLEACLKEKDQELVSMVKKIEPSIDPSIFEMVTKLKETERSLVLKIVNLEKELSQRQNSSDYFKRKLSETKRTQSEIQAKLDETLNSFEEMKKNIVESKVIAKRSQLEKMRLQEEYENIRKKLDSFMSRGYKNIISEDSKFLEELKYYQDLIKCPICLRRQRDHVLCRCMHVLCKECIDARIETRQRKCPICAEPFGASDMAKGLRSKRMQQNKRNLRASVMNATHDARLNEVSKNLHNLPNDISPLDNTKMDVVTDQHVSRLPSSSKHFKITKGKHLDNNTKKILKCWKTKKDHRWIPSN